MDIEKVGIWIRVSTEDQARGDSPKNHRERARHYAQYSKWEIDSEYDLSGVSGKTIINHPETQKMMRDVADGKIKGLIFSKIARLARNTKELIEIAEHFEKHGANLISLEEKIDTSSPAGRLLFTVIGALAQWEREEIASRVSASVKARALRGKPTGGKGPLGYEWKEKNLVINESEATVVREVYDTFLKTKKYQTTAKLLNAKGLRTRQGASFNKTTVKRILTDEVYMGRKKANYSRSKGNKKSWEFKKKDEWIYFDVEPIIDPDAWIKINHLIKQIEMKYPSEPLFLGKYSFSGLLHCTCGGKMYAHVYKGVNYSCKKCGNKLSESVLTDHVKQGLQQIVVHPEQLAESSEQDKKVISEKETLLKNLKLELNRINKRKDTLIYRENDIPQGEFSSRFGILIEQEKQVNENIPILETEIRSLKTSEIGKKDLLAQASELSKLWDSLDKDTQVKLTKELIHKVIVDKDKITFEFFYLPDFMQFGKSDHVDRGSWRSPA